MKFKQYWIDLSPDEKKSLAKKLGSDTDYMSQIAHGHRKAGPGILVNILVASDKLITPQDLRPDKIIRDT